MQISTLEASFFGKQRAYKGPQGVIRKEWISLDKWVRGSRNTTENLLFGHLEMSKNALSEKNGVIGQGGGKPMWAEGGAAWKFLRISQGIKMTGTDLFLSTEQRPAKWTYRRLDPCSTMNFWYFPGGPVVENPPCNAGDVSLIPGQGARIPHATTREQLRSN